jgi:hypothetical protein
VIGPFDLHARPVPPTRATVADAAEEILVDSSVEVIDDLATDTVRRAAEPIDEIIRAKRATIDDDLDRDALAVSADVPDVTAPKPTVHVGARGRLVVDIGADRVSDFNLTVSSALHD